MASSTPSRAKMQFPSPLVELPAMNAYKCLGCRQVIEVPMKVQGQPEEMLVWLEEIHSQHGRECAQAHAERFDRYLSRQYLTGQMIGAHA